MVYAANLYSNDVITIRENSKFLFMSFGKSAGRYKPPHHQMQLPFRPNLLHKESQPFDQTHLKRSKPFNLL
jgi:hypothetical protein